MKKRILLVISLLLTLCILTGCMVMPISSLTDMLPNQRSSSENRHAADPDTDDSSDTVTISREQYERYKKFDTIIEMMDVVNTYYYEDVDEKTMLDGAASGLLDAIGDPYTFYYSPEDFAEMWSDDEGEYAGIGVQISTSYVTGLCTISRVFKGGPAEAAGVQKGDILYRVGEDLYVNSDTVDEAVSIMRGTPGTDVEVTFLRKGEEMTFTITRATVTVNRIDSGMLDESIGYIYLYEFAGNCAAEFKQALDALIEQGAKGLIIDLRDNGGGWVNDAQSIADNFVDQGTLCYLEYKDGSRDYYYTSDGKVDLPLVILLNENTASSSEILTGCLRDRAHATVVGVNSYGKGIVQAVLYVGTEGAGMQVTEAQYFTPNGHAVHKVGILPDVVAEMPEDAPTMYEFGDLSDYQLNVAYETMKEKLQ